VRKRNSGIDQIDDLVTLLKTDELRNINILNFIEENPVLGIEKTGNSVLVRGKSDHQWIFVSSTNEDELRTLAEKLDVGDDHFAAVDDWMVPILSKGKEVVWNLSMIQFILPEEVKMPKVDFETKRLSLKDVNRVYENSNYRDFISIEYVKDRILCGPSVAIHEKNQLVAWAMTQDDGAMGFLHVLDNYRNRGYGYGVTVALIERLRKQGKRAFVYIEQDNQKAIRLVSKLGFEWDKNVHWFQIKRKQ
jgi:ribosomal protein S18 acetylase RimI-like enzyme